MCSAGGQGMFNPRFGLVPAENVPVKGTKQLEGDGAKIDEFLFVEIQSFARGFIMRRRIENSIREKLSSHHADAVGGRQLHNTEILKMGFFVLRPDFSMRNDKTCIFQLCELMAISMRRPSIAESFASLFLSAKFIGASCRFTTKLFGVALNFVCNSDVSKISDSRRVIILSQLLDLCSACSEQNWPILKGNKEVVPILSNLCQKIIGSSASKENILSLIKITCEGLKGIRQNLSGCTIDHLSLVCVRLIKVGSFGEDDKCFLLAELLKSPAIAFALSNQVLNESFLVEMIIWMSAQPSEKIESLKTNEALNLLANLIFIAQKDKKVFTEHLAEWACLINFLLEYCSQKRGKQMLSNSWHHPLLGWTEQRFDEQERNIFPRLQHQISFLWGKEMVKHLSDNFFPNFETKDPENQSKSRKSSRSNSASANLDVIQRMVNKFSARIHLGPFGSDKQCDRSAVVKPIPLPPISLPVILCQLYRNAMLTFQNSKIDILSGLSRDDSLILTKLWGFISDDLESTSGYCNYLGYLVADPEVKAPHFAPLSLFADITFSLISILDEKEMYEDERPFTLDQLRHIAAFANKFCFYAIWNSLIDFTKSEPSALFNSIYQLLGILYSRDCRRSFTMESDFWTNAEVNPKALIQEYEQTGLSQRAHQLMEKMPHIIPLQDRIVLFRRFISRDKESSILPPTIITVERSRIIEDGYRQLGNLSENALRGTIRVKFINQQGLDEAGIDQDGVFKEFLELTLKRVFAPDLNLFRYSHDNLLYPSSTSAIHDNHLELFKFVGRMLAKAVYEGICVDVQLAPVLLASVLDKQLCPFDELASLDPVLYKSLTFVKHYSDSADVSDLALTFSFQEEFIGKLHTFELISGGREAKVNNDNRISYIHLMSHYRIIKQTQEQTAKFVEGFRSIIKERWLSLFSTHELQFLISGQLSDVDLEDLRKSCHYYGGFHNNHRLIKWLWSILKDDFTSEERRLFLKFITSCSRPPLLGFAFLEPCFSIRCVETSDDLDQGDTLGSVVRGFLTINRKKKQHINERLPTASTCFNLLKLPNYTKRSILLEKLRYAIHAETGFELS